MTHIAFVTLETPDAEAAERFYTDVFGLTDHIRVAESHEPTSGFRGFTLSLIVAQPSNADLYLTAAVEAGAEPLKPAKKSLWGYGGVVRSPDGVVWQVSTSQKKDTGKPSREYDDVVLLLGVNDVADSKRFYVEHGLEVAKSYGRKYAEFTSPAEAVKLALNNRRTLAKVAGVPAEGSGSHRLTIGTDTESFIDPDGFHWKAETQRIH
ncbi:MAG TPA: glyoxalase [Candidatus Stackebrandtia excrementipullorum]|nr:glyoxalase [Candidatus Stackebrandtia excrementipullorum]